MDKWLSHPTALKILSIVIGILLWAVVHFDPSSTPNTVTSTTETKSVDMLRIQTEGLDESAYALKMLEPSVGKLMVRGSRSALAFAEDDDYSISVNLAGKGPGSYTIPLTVGKLPRGIELLNVSPSTVEVIIDRLDSGSFEAGVVTQGTPAEGYELGAPVIRPGGAVQVTLPAQDLARVGSVKVFVNVDGETETVRDKKAHMIVFDKSGNEIQGAVIEPATLDVEVPVTMPGKAVPLQVGTKGSLPSGLSLEAIDTDVSEVTVYGERSMLDGVNLLAADVDLSQIRATGDVELELLPPEGMKAVEPSKVKVRVTLASSDVKTLQVPVRLENAGDGLDAALEAPAGSAVSISVRGTPDELSGLTAGDIRAVADLQDLKEGTHEVRLQLTLPNYVSAVGEAPTVTVRLAASEPAMGRPEGGSATPSPTPSPDRGPSETDSSGGSGPAPGSGGSDNDAAAGDGGAAADSGEERR
ncbi:hypothetical protein HGI30_03370 [Paenibacillus albicereus]|uniref:YbbR-like domain-containing protein n=1 Tax=Paenibacillus albicereus TaxID=2726185 RepID=A0A6H2GU81_9BACL|nr:CdaR family protein [Paenibacillus albicereus]QJC50708.1 hypothetical protein HGI30_03370 [Paenibacillus albicereus]